MPDPESGRPPGQRPDLDPRADTRADDTVSATTPGSGSGGTGPPILEGLDRLGPYRIVRLLGGGGMGQVYEAIHEESGHRLAIKILPPNVLGSERARERFLREGTLAASINHPNSLYVYGTEEVDGLPLIAMELAPGGTLKDRIDAEGPLDPSEVVGAALQIVDALEAAAECGVLHRDVKPSNCFVDRDGSIKVGDYGLSISTTEEEATQLTATGAFLGTPAYASPEQIRGGNVDQRSDIYSVGATLHFLLSGQRPFAERTGLQLMASILEEEPVSLRQVRADVPKRLSSVIMRCLRKDPAERFVDYAELRRALAPLARMEERAAGLRDRFLAGFVDSFVVAVPVALLSTLLLGEAGVVQGPFGPRGFWFDALAVFVLRLAYGTILEGRWGITAGKVLFGLRVAAPDGGPPGVPNAAVRSLVYLAPRTLLAVLAAWLVTVDLRTGAVIVSASAPIGLLIPFITARKANGYEAIHDGLTRTQVLAARQRSERPRLPRGGPAKPIRSGARVGPFEVANVATRPGTVLEGYDPRLRRRVWIRVESPDAPAVNETRRGLSRRGRLRWLNGRRADRDSWDAFEAVDGRPFPEAARAAHPWSVVHLWLRDLADELRAAEEDGTLPFLPQDDAVWITDDGRAMLLEFAAPGTESKERDPAPDHVELGVGAAQASLARFAHRALAGGAGHVAEPGPPAIPLPLFARRLLERLGAAAFPSLEDMRREIESLSRRGTAVGRGRRALHHAIPALVPVFAVITFAITKTIFDHIWTEHRDAQLLECAATELIRLSRAEARTEEEEIQRAALEVYVAGPARHTLPDPEVAIAGTSVRRLLLRPEEEKWLQEFWETHEVSAGAELAEATENLQPLFQKEGPLFGGLNRMQIVAAFAVLAVAVTGMLVAPLGLLFGTLFRGGIILRLLGIAVVGDDGAPIGRARALLRSLVAWLPALGLPLLLRGQLRTLLRSGESPGPLLVLLTLLFVAGVVWALVTPQRGPQDRVARTWLVPQ